MQLELAGLVKANEAENENRRIGLAEKGETVEFIAQGETATRRQLLQLIRSQDYKCALSGVALEPNDAELDHKIPVAKGGDHSIGNLQVLHKVVNRMKSQMTSEELVRWCRLIASHTPGGV
jgi:CRISPR/Cas system Type II protein with McrA/HNH and RuvC-like nuclease domain